MEECYGSGLVRMEAMPQQAVVDAVQLQPVVETLQTFVEPLEPFQAPLEFETNVPAEGQLTGEVEAQQEQQPGPPRVVIICTSAEQMGDQPTGAWSEEITGPYYVFTEAGCEVYIASVQGGKVPIDQGSLSENFLTENDRRFNEEGCLQFLDHAYAIGDVSPDAIDCVWLAGGHGTCMDFEASLAQFVTDAAALGRPVGAVCHGVIGLLSAIDQNGAPLLAGKQVTGFSNAEEEAVGLADKVPFLLQDRMMELGCSYSCGEPWTEYAIRDGKIITGQNPQSSVRTAQLCVEAMMTPY
jgi:putative intracellular protease/amidase